MTSLRAFSVLVAVGLTFLALDVSAQPISFGTAVNYTTAPGNGDSVAVADLNGDGILDLVTTSSIGNAVFVQIGAAGGSFGPHTSVTAGTNPRAVVIADVDSDGNADLVVANNSSANISVLLGNGNGTFALATHFAAGTGPISVAVGDLNRDGNPDVVVANAGGNVSVLLGTGGSPLLGTATNFAAGLVPFHVSIGDVNRDGLPDLAVANQVSDSVSILLGTGTAAMFAPAVDFVVGDAPVSTALGDFNSDGKPDLAVANFFGDSISVLLGTGTAALFGAASNTAIGDGLASVALADFNGDGRTDLAASSQGTNQVIVLPGTGAGTFGAAASFSVASAPRTLTAGDFDRDGRPDVAVINSVVPNNNVSVLLNTTAFTAAGSFGPPIHLAAGTGPLGIAIGDLNHDGKADIVASNGQAESLSIFIGTGTGAFGAATTFSFSGFFTPNAVAIADFDRDGKADLAVPGQNGDQVAVLLGTGAGGIASVAYYAVGDFPAFVAVGDFDRDGIADLAVTNFGINPEPNALDDSVSILLGNGDGTFSSASAVAVGEAPGGVAVGDFNRDGKLDLATANRDTDNVSVLLGNGDGTFSIAVAYSAGDGPTAVQVADFDRDGTSDLAVGNFFGVGSSVSILLGNGDGTFGAAVNFAVENPIALAIADVNRDGKSDVVTTTHGGNGIAVLIGDGAGGLGAPATFNAGSMPDAIAIGDVNGDGRLDVATANFLGNDVSVLLNVGPPADTTAPTGTVLINGGAMFTTSAAATLTLSCADAGSGCAQMQIAVDGTADTEPFEPVAASKGITITGGDGTKAVAVRFRDAAGNTSLQVSDTIVLDTTAPTLSVPANIATPATGPSGAMVVFSASASDTVDPAPVVVCSPASGSTFPIGTTTVTCTATDFAGHSQSGTFTVTVEGAAARLGDLIDTVNSFNIQPAGVANSLNAKLQNAIAAANAGDLTTACSQLNAFINQVQAQSGNKLTVAQANQLIASANQVKAVLGCP